MSPSHDPFAAAGPGVSSVEFRGAPRYRLLQRCIVRPSGVNAADGWRGIVFSMSKSGAGVTLPTPVNRGAELEIEPWNLPGAPVLRGTVVHLTRLESVWLAGCEFTRQLTDAELVSWSATAIAG